MNSREYPDRPFLAVSAAIIRDGQVLLVQRAGPLAAGLYTLPGGIVEAGETLEAALVRECREETGLEIAPIALAGHRDVIARDADGRVRRHFVVLPFACRLTGGSLALNEELADAAWFDPAQVGDLPTTEGLAPIVAAALALTERGNLR